MGNAPSTPEVPGGGSDGYHVLKVADNSPGSRAGLEQFFDFIIGINNHRLDEESDILKTVCTQNMGKPVRLLVYSSKDQSVRALDLNPSDTWGGKGLLGVSIRFSSFDGASENIWHVLDVTPGSPAANAGLISNTDYIIAADSALDDRDDLFALIENENLKELRLYVYNSVTDQCRPVTIIPNKDWGGEGSLGCGIGFGYLHRIPPPEERAKLQNKHTPDQVAVPITMDSSTPVQAAVPAAVTPAPISVPAQNPNHAMNEVAATGTIYTTSGPPNYTVSGEALANPAGAAPPSTATPSSPPATPSVADNSQPSPVPTAAEPVEQGRSTDAPAQIASASPPPTPGSAASKAAELALKQKQLEFEFQEQQLKLRFQQQQLLLEQQQQQQQLQLQIEQERLQLQSGSPPAEEVASMMLNQQAPVLMTSSGLPQQPYMPETQNEPVSVPSQFTPAAFVAPPES